MPTAKNKSTYSNIEDHSNQKISSNFNFHSNCKSHTQDTNQHTNFKLHSINSKESIFQNSIMNAMKYSESCTRLTDFQGRPSELESERIQKSIENKLIRSMDTTPKVFHLHDIIPSITDGAQVIKQDDFSLCFATTKPDPQNQNPFLYVIQCFGIFVRYCIFFPFRVTIFIVGSLIFFILFIGIRLLIPEARKEQRILQERQALLFLDNVWIISFTGVIRQHGVIPKHEPNQIYVANHTTLIDYVILQQVAPFVAIGQKHHGWVGYFQKLLRNSVGGLQFERGESRDRKRMSEIIRQYISKVDIERNRLLVFPEGTCVNMDYCVQFKRGAFDVGATICPIAIKYNGIFVDAYWNSREKSFQRHLFDLMTSWALVCDIYFLEPQTMREGEDAIQFAQRVKDMICEAAQIRGVDQNGYLKYFRPSKRFVEQRQKVFAERLLNRYNDHDSAHVIEDFEEQSKNCLESMQNKGILRRRLIKNINSRHCSPSSNSSNNTNTSRLSCCCSSHNKSTLTKNLSLKNRRDSSLSHQSSSCESVSAVETETECSAECLSRNGDDNASNHRHEQHVCCKCKHRCSFDKSKHVLSTSSTPIRRSRSRPSLQLNYIQNSSNNIFNHRNNIRTSLSPLHRRNIRPSFKVNMPSSSSSSGDDCNNDKTS